jgi:tetratricopeptide (TPR) repeat protein
MRKDEAVKYFPAAIAAILLTLHPANAFEETFSRAQTAYDEGRYSEAVALYQQMVSDGIENPELHYNLANAAFKNSNLPLAVWHYRKAAYTAPRDPDIRANMRFALNATGAIEPSPGFIPRLLGTLSKSEWIAIGAGSYTLLILLLILALLVRPARRSLVKLSLLPTAFMLLAAGGWIHWANLTANPEGVVVQSGATALYGPVEGTTPYYKIPTGALVRQKSLDPKGWVEVLYDNKEGWVQQEYISTIYP